MAPAIPPIARFDADVLGREAGGLTPGVGVGREGRADGAVSVPVAGGRLAGPSLKGTSN